MAYIIQQKKGDTVMANMTKKKTDLLLLHVAITMLLVFGIGFIKPIGMITPLGMKFIGIFLGVIYAWTATNSLIWPSMLGMVAVSVSGVMKGAEFFKICFGSEIVLLILLILVFMAVIEELGLVAFLGNWIMSRKFIVGRPWIFTLTILFGTLFCAIFVNELATVFVFWQILYNVCDKAGFKAHDKYMVLMILGIAMISVNLGGLSLPFKASALFFLSTYTSLSGMPLNMATYILFTSIISVGFVLFYVAVMRFVFKADVSLLKQIDNNTIDASNLKINKQQKYGLVFLILMLVLMLMSDLLPADMFIKQILTQIGKVGIMLILLMVMFWVKIDGQPMLNFPVAARGISWDMIFMFAFIIPFSNIMVSDATGIRETITAAIAPMLDGKSPFVFVLFILVTGTLITNFLNNTVVFVIYVGMMVSLGEAMNINIIPIFLTFIYTVTLAFLTPAGSAPAAMVFGQTKWLDSKDVYKIVPILLTLMFIYFFAVGYPLANILF